jgi:putative two-component system hydrogenase maturation factor HypX/HoxX
MRILLLAHAFNSLAQRIYVELAARGHELSVELDINDAVTLEAVDLFEPDLVVAPFMKRAIPEAVWRRHVCLVVHPGIVGDRGSSSLDWAVLDGKTEWGVTVLQANGVMDGGAVWASRTFPMREASKASLYRREVTEAATAAVLEAIEKLRSGGKPLPSEGEARPAMTQGDRRIDWSRDTTATVLRKIHASDGHPGVLDRIGDLDCRLFGAHREDTLRGLRPGDIVARREGAILRATVDGAVWITHLKPEGGFKLPAAQVLGEAIAHVPDARLSALPLRDPRTWQDIAYEEASGVGFLAFEFHNGAMSTSQCERLREAFLAAANRPTRAIVLLGGEDFWSNGIDLNAIEAADSAADESWRNIVAMDDLCRAIVECDTHVVIAAMRGNAGAGGVFLALAADLVLAREGITLNPHYKGMGNLYGSEYWTYLLPRRIGWEAARAMMERRLPMGAEEAVRCGLVDASIGGGEGAFRAEVVRRAVAIAGDPGLAETLERKRTRREADEHVKPLASYRAEELERMRLNFYGFDPSYHVARYHFVHKVPHAWTPLHLAVHRRRGWREAHGKAA